MATGIDFSPPFALLEGGGYSKDNVSATNDESSDSFNSLKQMTTGKPPRHLSVSRHSVSSIKLLDQADLVSNHCYIFYFAEMQINSLLPFEFCL